MQKLLPDAEVHSFTPMAANAALWEPHLQDSDIVLTQEFSGAVYGNGQTDAVRAMAAQVSLLPKVYFNGYHPDITHVHGLTVRNSDALTDYHSSIAIAGFLAGRSPKQTKAMFNKYIYSRAGYLEAFEIAKILLLRHFSDLGFDMEDALQRWCADGPFMYTVNHPKIHVLTDIMQAVVEKLGLSKGVALDALPVDALAKSTGWPLYPEIAKDLDVDAGAMRVVRTKENNPLDMDWLDFIETCHKLYATVDPQVLKRPKVLQVLAAL